MPLFFVYQASKTCRLFSEAIERQCPPGTNVNAARGSQGITELIKSSISFFAYSIFQSDLNVALYDSQEQGPN
jgi:hypothetical protein